MIKIFRGGAGGDDTFKTPSPYEQLLPLPTLCFKIMTPRPPTTPLQATFTATPIPIHHPFSPKNFDNTQGGRCFFVLS